MKHSLAKSMPARLAANPVFITAALALFISLVLAAFGVRGFRAGQDAVAPATRVGGKFFETFYNTTAQTLPSNWKGPKTPLVAINGLHWFFSDGSLAANATELSKHVLFLPSEKDTLCYYTKYDAAAPDIVKNGPVEVNCRQIVPHEFTQKDPRDISLQVTCSNGKMDAPPLDVRDAEMRILNSTYHFHKRCLIMQDARLTRTAGTALIMELPASSYTTKVFMLLRPVLVHSLNSQVYTVSYAATGDYAVGENSPLNYNSSSTQKVRVVLKPAVPFMFENKYHTMSVGTASIADDAMATHAAMMESSQTINGSTMQQAMSGSVSSDYLMLNLYYPTPKESLIEVQRKPAQGFTCVFRNPTKGLQPTAGVQIFNRELNVAVSKQVGSTKANTVTVSRGTSVGQLEQVPLDATIVVAYSHNLVTVCAMSPGSRSIQVKRFPSFSVLEVPDAFNSTLHTTLMDVMKSSGIQYEVFALPNLLHLALDLKADF